MTVTHINPEALHRSPAFTQAVRVSGAATMVYVGGQNGVDHAGSLVGPDLASQARQALANLQECLKAAGGTIDNVVKWTILVRDGEPLHDGFAAFTEAWGGRPNPPAITVALVSSLAVPGAVVEIEAIAAIPT
jgi:enamine deaminase RidA (YjgF/YER057c/UK114 family)